MISEFPEGHQELDLATYYVEFPVSVKAVLAGRYVAMDATSCWLYAGPKRWALHFCRPR